MAKQQVVESTCDRCHTSVEEPLSSGIKNGNYLLPRDWLHVTAFTNNHTVFEMDLCVECKRKVLDAAGKGAKTRTLKAVSQSA